MEKFEMPLAVLCLSSPGQERLQLNGERSLDVTSMGGGCRKEIEFVAVESVCSAFRREGKREVSLLCAITCRHVAGIFLELHSEIMIHNRYELQYREIPVGYYQNITMVVVKYVAPAVDTLVFFNVQDSTGQLCNRIHLTLLRERNWIRRSLGVSFSLNFFGDI